MTSQRFFSGCLAFTLGCVVLKLGSWLTGVRTELYWGLATFSGAWILATFLVPFISGFVVSKIFGLGGKWLCYFPPMLVTLLSYAETAASSGLPAGAKLMPMGWWGFFVILVIESAAFGGAIGEYMTRKGYDMEQAEKDA